MDSGGGFSLMRSSSQMMAGLKAVPCRSTGTKVPRWVVMPMPAISRGSTVIFFMSSFVTRQSFDQ